MVYRTFTVQTARTSIKCQWVKTTNIFPKVPGSGKIKSILQPVDKTVKPEKKKKRIQLHTCKFSVQATPQIIFKSNLKGQYLHFKTCIKIWKLMLQDFKCKMKSVRKFASISLLIEKPKLQGSGSHGLSIEWQIGFKLKPTKAK